MPEVCVHADIAEGAVRVPQLDPKGKGKARVRRRPKVSGSSKIDLDEEIAEANKLAEASRKNLMSAKNVEKKSPRQKHKLVRKAGKLSAEDLERIAVLKRCGLYAEMPDNYEQEHHGTDSCNETGASSSSCANPSLKKSSPVTAFEKIRRFGNICKDLDSASDKIAGDVKSLAVEPHSAKEFLKRFPGVTISRGRRLGPRMMALTGTRGASSKGKSNTRGASSSLSFR